MTVYENVVPTVAVWFGLGVPAGATLAGITVMVKLLEEGAQGALLMVHTKL